MLLELGNAFLLSLFLNVLEKSKNKINLYKIIFIIIKIILIILILFNISLINELYSKIITFTLVNDKIYNKLFGFFSQNSGSLLLWIFIIVIYKYLFSSKYLYISSKIKILKEIKNYYLFFFLYFFFLFFLINNFFHKINIDLNIIYFKENLFNIGLQNFLLILHPPILFYGYLGVILIFLVNMLKKLNQNLLLKNFDLILYKELIKIYLSLLLGICLGSIWAYTETGWGGWWFWDPIENISLIIWLFLNLFLHIINLNYFSFSIYVDILTLVFFLFNYYLKSKVINSVHLFDLENNNNIIYNSFGIIVIIIILILLNYNNFYLNKHNLKFNILNYKKVVKKNIYSQLLFIIYIMFLIGGTMVGTINGIYYLNNSIIISSEFFNIISLGVLLLFLILMNNNIINNYNSFLINVINSLYIFFYIYKENINCNLITIFYLNLLWFGLCFLMLKLLNEKDINMNLSHIFFYLFSIFLFFNKEQYFISNEIKLYENNKYLNMNIILRNFHFTEYKNEIEIILNFLVKINNKNIMINSDEKLLGDGIFTYNVQLSNLFNDIIISINNRINEHMDVKILINPFINLIWLNIILFIILYLLLNLLLKNKLIIKK